MKNQVIKNLNRETGIKIIKYWKSKSIDTCGLVGDNTEEVGEDCIYYGIIDNNFSTYTLKEVREADAEIIELLEVNKEKEELLRKADELIQKAEELKTAASKL